MKITKTFRFEGSHVVRNCTSQRCSHSVHGHSYLVEIEFEGRHLDNAQMLYDFGLMKSTIKSFIDSMDHCHIICNADSPEYVKFFQDHNERWIMVPFNPSAEMLSVFIMKFVQLIMDHTITNNDEDKDLKVSSVTVHETTTGRATCDAEDVKNLWNELWTIDVCFSNGVIADWCKELHDIIFGNAQVKNPKVKQQIVLISAEDLKV